MKNEWLIQNTMQKLKRNESDKFVEWQVDDSQSKQWFQMAIERMTVNQLKKKNYLNWLTKIHLANDQSHERANLSRKMTINPKNKSDDCNSISWIGMTSKWWWCWWWRQNPEWKWTTIGGLSYRVRDGKPMNLVEKWWTKDMWCWTRLVKADKVIKRMNCYVSFEVTTIRCCLSQFRRRTWYGGDGKWRCLINLDELNMKSWCIQDTAGNKNTHSKTQWRGGRKRDKAMNGEEAAVDLDLCVCMC